MEKFIIIIAVMVTLLYPVIKIKVKLEEKNKIKDRINRYFKDDE